MNAIYFAALVFELLSPWTGAGGLLAVGRLPEDQPLPAPSISPLVVEGATLEGAWVEMTPYDEQLDPWVLDLGRHRDEDQPLLLAPPFPAGKLLVCAGGEEYGVLCEPVYREEMLNGSAAGPVFLNFQTGLVMHGRYLQGFDPVDGARIAVVPDGLEMRRPFTMPLALPPGVRAARQRLQRLVETDDTGAFELPPLAPGDYFLETLLPSGRLHRSEPFSVPSLEIARFRAGTPDEKAIRIDLGTINVEAGLTLRIRALDADNEPLAGVRVAASQGETARDLRNFEAFTDPEGYAVLDGFSAEAEVRLRCLRRGFEPWEEVYDLVPVEETCLMNRWAEILGEVIGPDGLPVPNATLSIQRITDDDGDSVDEKNVTHQVNGRFEIGDLAAGSFELHVAAPGYQVETRSFELDTGQALDLGTVLLLLGRPLEVIVVDAESEAPIAGVEATAVAPAGAVGAVSDLDGELTITVPDDEEQSLVVRFEVPDYAPLELAVDAAVLESGAPWRVEMSPAGWILAVVEVAGGDPCRDCRVRIWPGGEVLRTDGFGEALSGPLAPGSYRVGRSEVWHMGSVVVEIDATEIRPVRVKPGVATRVVFEATEDATFVRLDPQPEGRWLLSAQGRHSVQNLEAEEDGRFRLPRRPNESLELYLKSWDEVSDEEEAVWQMSLPSFNDTEELRLRLPNTLLRGRVRITGGPAIGSVLIRLRRLADGALHGWTHADANGAFELPYVQPGAYSVYVGDLNTRFIVVSSGQRLDLGWIDVPAQ